MDSMLYIIRFPLVFYENVKISINTVCWRLSLFVSLTQRMAKKAITYHIRPRLVPLSTWGSGVG